MLPGSRLRASSCRIGPASPPLSPPTRLRWLDFRPGWRGARVLAIRVRRSSETSTFVTDHLSCYWSLQCAGWRTTDNGNRVRGAAQIFAASHFQLAFNVTPLPVPSRQYSRWRTLVCVRHSRTVLVMRLHRSNSTADTTGISKIRDCLTPPDMSAGSIWLRAACSTLRWGASCVRLYEQHAA
ncbi:hypothetical protein BDZ89DRAFT_530552 [Hymenopellis radicata]|nr:hypothetical protein BDZ89DRAFT_530552 [Hymenopellis radicata]